MVSKSEVERYKFQPQEYYWPYLNEADLSKYDSLMRASQGAWARDAYGEEAGRLADQASGYLTYCRDLYENRCPHCGQIVPERMRK